MKRVLLIFVAMAVVGRAWGQEAGRAPAEGTRAVEGSAVENPSPDRSAGAAALRGDGTDANPSPSPSLRGRGIGGAYPRAEGEGFSPSPSSQPVPAESEEALRRAVWNSAEMLDARAYVLEYSQRLAGSSRSQGERYLQRVSELSSKEMSEWLKRIQERRAALERQRLVEEEARQWSIEQAVARLQEPQQAGFNAQRAKDWIAELWMEGAAERALVEQSKVQRKGERAAAVDGLRLAFDPFAPSLDPASPGAYERYAAAASLPGDLPRGDPANFYVGDDQGGSVPPPGSDGAVGGGAGEAAAGGGAE